MERLLQYRVLGFRYFRNETIERLNSIECSYTREHTLYLVSALDLKNDRPQKYSITKKFTSDDYTRL